MKEGSKGRKKEKGKNLIFKKRATCEDKHAEKNIITLINSINWQNYTFV